jgi:hypothetical protein
MQLQYHCCSAAVIQAVPMLLLMMTVMIGANAAYDTGQPQTAGDGVESPEAGQQPLSLGPVRSRTTNVHDDPKRDSEPQSSKSVFKPTVRNITVSPGERAVFKCKVENLGTKTVTWRKRDEVHPLTIGMYAFAPDSRITVDYNQRTSEWLLTIQDVRPSDEGYYCCQISTKHDRDTYDIRLNVRTIQVSGTEYVESGSPIQLMCNATGRPEPPYNVDWFKDGAKIQSDAQSGIIITKKIETRVLVSMLVIKNSKMADGGTYVCRSSNDEEGSFVVHILNVPPITAAEKRVDKTYVVGRAASSSPQHDHVTTVALVISLQITWWAAIFLASLPWRPGSGWR